MLVIYTIFIGFMKEQTSKATNEAKVIWNAESLSEALGITNIPANIEINSVSIDSRNIKPKSLFIGIEGENFNGGEYAAESLKKGAVLAIVNKNVKVSSDLKTQVIQVDDTLEVLNKLAAYSRKRVKGSIVGVTGSVGKTSTKEMLSLALSQQGEVYISEGNFNNEYGLPLSLANMPQDTDFGIFEMAMRGPGQISELSKLSRPEVAIITNIEPVHLEFFNSTAGIADAKSEIYDGMEKGYAIINADNPYYQIINSKAVQKKLQIITFAENNKANFQLIYYAPNNNTSEITTEVFGVDMHYTIGLTGKQHAMNSLAVLAAVHALGGDVQNAAYQLRYFKAQPRRGEIIVNNKGVTIIDDSYNASPASVQYALENLHNFRKSATRLIAVLGDMRELGHNGPQYHKDLMGCIVKLGIDEVFTVGDLMHHLHEALPANIKAAHTNNSQEMAALIAKEIKSGDVIMVKGSFSMNMNLIVKAINC